MELIFNGVVGVLILVYMFFALQFGVSTVQGDVFGAGGFPIVIAVIGLVVLTLITINVKKSKTAVHIPMFDLKSASGRMVALNVLALTAYVFLMDVIGFALSTFLYLVAGASSMGYSKYKALAIYTVIVSVVLVVVFGKVFFIPLPRGIGIFRELSYFIY